MKGKKFLLKKHPEGLPKVTDFELVEEELPAVQDGEVLLACDYLSVDPYMRYKSASIPLNTVMPCQTVARVVESKHPEYKVGAHVLTTIGWRSHIVGNPEKMINTYDGSVHKVQLLPDFGGAPTSLALGVLGMPGLTALFGLIDLTHPKAGETLVVTGAAGAVGSIVGQLGKILGLKVIGFAGDEDKIAWLKELGFDHVYNYKTTDVSKALKESAPEGVDIYFDNVGGKIAFDVMMSMKDFGRVSCCGAISSYNDLGGKSYPMAPAIQIPTIGKQLTLYGFMVTRWMDKFPEGMRQLLGYLKQGKLKYKETITEGFDKMPEAFISLFHGENIGKAIVKV